MPLTVVRHESEHLYADQPKTDAGRKLSEAILHLWRAERNQMEQAQRSSELSTMDLTALRYLVQARRDDRDFGPKDLMVMLNTSSATVTNVVDRLVARGFVRRVEHPTDRRAHFVVATDAAIQRVDDSFAPHHSAIVAVIDGLPEHEAECAADVVRRIAEELDKFA